MTSFKTRIAQISKSKGKIILANDYDQGVKNLESKTISNIRNLSEYLCGIKLNFHLLLPLSSKEIIKINKISHSYGIQTIADIKLNDIGNTNSVTVKHLWNLGFDAVIVNPIMGLKSLQNLVTSSHEKDKGIITLCHMSAPEARLSYELPVLRGKKQIKLYELFLEWALKSKADGIIVGATFPKIISDCKKVSKDRLSIFSPGVGVQGGDVNKVTSSGSDYLIVGRSILNAKNPIDVVRNLQIQTLG